MAALYKPTPGARISRRQAAVYGPHLESLAERLGGRMTPNDVLSDARKKRSPLHAYFEWDDSAAAEQYRMVQARYLLRVLVHVVEIEEQPVEVRAFLRIRDEEGAGYRPLAAVADSPEMQAQIVKRALRELRGVRRKYKQLQQLDRIWHAIEETEGALV